MFKIAQVKAISSIKDANYDSIVLICSSQEDLKEKYEELYLALKPFIDSDESALKDGAFVPINLPAKRLIFSPTGPLNRDYDDVRRFLDAADKGIKRALKTGSKSPMLVTLPSKFETASLVSLIGALHAVYVPLETRENSSLQPQKVEKIGFLGDQKTVDLALALESGRTVARDIGGGDPERMAAPRVEEYVLQMLKGTNVSIEVISDDRQLCKEYPLFSAVNRCAKHLPRHRGRILYLTYEGKGPIEKTLLIVGKGVTYDTGGADIKTNGIMPAMTRDKCGAAAAAGFMKTVSILQPPNIKVIVGLAMVRNSVGSECYVPDEVIISRAGKRVRVNNTDAEGRFAMADLLCRMKEIAPKEKNPHLMTIATLTGHVKRTYGDAYSAVMDNGPAFQESIALEIQKGGDAMAEPLEVSRIRREDYAAHGPTGEYEDLVQVSETSASKTHRGHQGPAAFLILSSGLDKHGIDSDVPLKYTHLDIAGSAMNFPGIPTATPLLALAKTFLPLPL